MQDTAGVTLRPPAAAGWYCSTCDVQVEIRQKLDHITSPRHRARAAGYKPAIRSTGVDGRHTQNTRGVAVRGNGGRGGGVGLNQELQEEDKDEKYTEAGDNEEESDTEEESETDEEDSEEDTEEEYDTEEEDEEEYEEDEEGGEDEEAEEGEEYDRSRMLWTCTICDKTINIFTRDEHLLSRAHILEARKTTDRPTKAPAEQPYVPMWRCTLCDEEMTVFLQGDHKIGKQHLKMLRKLLDGGEAHSSIPDTNNSMLSQHQHDDNPPDEIPELYAGLPNTAASSSYEFKTTFYCATCADEFDLSMQDLHLDTSETWDCTLCSTTIHPAYREQHLESEWHLEMLRRSQLPAEEVFCDVCQKSYVLVERQDHLAGVEHQTMAAREELKKKLLDSIEENGGVELHNSTPEALPRTKRSGGASSTNHQKDPGHCPKCKQPLYSEPLSNHLRWHCTGATKSSKPPKCVPNVAGTFHCDICNKKFALAGKDGHLAGQKHQAKAARKAAKAAKPVKKKKKVPPEGSLYCDACDKYNLPAAMADHKNSKKHKKKVARKLAQGNSLPPVNPPTVPRTQPVKPVVTKAQYTKVSGDTFYCQVCHRHRQLVGMEAHVASKSHKKAVAAEQAKKLAPTPAPETNIVQSPTQPTARPTPTQTPASSSLEGKVYCIPCEKYKSRVGIEDHNKSKKHKRKVTLARA